MRLDSDSMDRKIIRISYQPTFFLSGPSRVPSSLPDTSLLSAGTLTILPCGDVTISLLGLSTTAAENLSVTLTGLFVWSETENGNFSSISYHHR